MIWSQSCLYLKFRVYFYKDEQMHKHSQAFTELFIDLYRHTNILLSVKQEFYVRYILFYQLFYHTIRRQT